MNIRRNVTANGDGVYWYRLFRQMRTPRASSTLGKTAEDNALPAQVSLLAVERGRGN